MKFGLNWKGAVGVFVVLGILLVVLFVIKARREEPAQEVLKIKEKEDAIAEKEKVIKAAQREIDEEVLKEEKERVLKVARRDFEELTRRKDKQEDLKKSIEQARNLFEYKQGKIKFFERLKLNNRLSKRGEKK